jgi:SAM-dependent methyltransferase
MKSKETYTKKIYTYSGITKEDIFQNGEEVLHIGSGKNVLKGAQTIDILDLPGVDTVHDLDRFPWPYSENSFDLIYAHSVFEHLADTLKAMEEMSRILKPYGRVIITVPHFRSTDAFADPTHKHFFTSKSMDYFIEGSGLHDYEYTKVKYKKIGFWFGWPQEPTNPISKFVKNLISKYPDFYDSHLSLLYPVPIVIWELEVIK